MSENGKYPQSIIKAINEVVSNTGYMQKTETHKMGYKYADELAVLAQVRPAMIKAGLVLMTSMRSQTGIDEQGVTDVMMEYTLAHIDGSVWPEKLTMGGRGKDMFTKGVGDKGIYKAITGAHKYFLFKLFLMPSGDDPEKSGPDTNGTLGKPQQHTKPKNKAAPDQATPDQIKGIMKALIGLGECNSMQDIKPALAYCSEALSKSIKRSADMTAKDADDVMFRIVADNERDLQAGEVPADAAV